MCGNYSFVIEDNLIWERFGIRVRTAVYKARYNCAPTQDLAVISNEDPLTLNFYRWGLIPSWAKDSVIGKKMINARAETILEKPSFKHTFRYHRCLVPATGFFEWRRDKENNPYYIRMKNREAFSFAGLWDKWVSTDGEIIHSFTIITTVPNRLVAKIHNRMPVILHREDERRWITLQTDSILVDLLKPYPEEMMEAYPVTKQVKSPENDSPEITEPLSPSIF
jgi:putative SOS response-associated peptidase YedK